MKSIYDNHTDDVYVVMKAVTDYIVLLYTCFNMYIDIDIDIWCAMWLCIFKYIYICNYYMILSILGCIVRFMVVYGTIMLRYNDIVGL